MTTSELMKAMADAGAPFEAILIAVQALDAKDAEIARREQEQSEKRAKDAKRKRNARAEYQSRRRPRNVRGRSAECPADPPIEEFIPPVSSDEETRPARKTKRVSAVPAKPEGVEDQVWADFVKHRQKKGGVTETAIEGIRREAKKVGWSLNAALAEVVSRNWQGFKADWALPAKPPDSGGNDLVERILRRQAAAR